MKNVLVKTVLFLIIALVTFDGNATLVFAQENSDPELEELKKQKEIAETKKAIAEAKKAEFEAQFPIPDADSLKGKTDVKGDLIESQIQAYKAMDIISDKIAEEIKLKTRITNLYVFNETDSEKIAAYKKFLQQIEVINNWYADCQPTGPGLGISGGGLIPSLLLNSLPLFKTDTSITASSFDISNEAVWSSLAQKLSARGISLHNPFISNVNELKINNSSNLVSQLNKIVQNASKPGCQNANYSTLKPLIDLKVAKILNLNPSTPETTQTTKTEDKSNPNKTVLEETITKNSANSSPANSVSWVDYLITEQIIDRMKQDQIFWIKIKNINSGGNMRIKSSPIVDIFRGGSSIKFSGGSIATYYLLDNEGKIILSGVVNSYTPYKKSGQIK